MSKLVGAFESVPTNFLMSLFFHVEEIESSITCETDLMVIEQINGLGHPHGEAVGLTHIHQRHAPAQAGSEGGDDHFHPGAQESRRLGFRSGNQPRR